MLANIVSSAHFVSHLPGVDLVTWSRDRTLRVWGISESLKHNLGGEPMEVMVFQDSMSSEQLASMSLSDEVELSITSQAEDYQQSPSLTRSLTKSLKDQSQSSLGSSPTKSISSVVHNDSLSSLNKSLSSQQVFQPQVAQTLGQEFSLLNLENIPSLEMERVSSHF